jgi:lipopolysaccharide transport system ATP-binding protein
MKPAIRVERVSKQYRLGQHQGDYRMLRESLIQACKAPWLRRRGSGETDASANSIWALRDVTLDVQPGEVVGIIGRNGAGKSTLLKILSRITEPTSGRVEIRGRLGSLLEVGTGFHPELTGRENIYMNGSILGMRRREIQQRFDEIVAFAEIERFLETPVKRYSSGMFMRLAFAVAAHLQPEILVVDEILAVGDVEFQKKCLGKIGEVSRQGRTVLFVSHNMAAVRKLCTRGILLKKGNLLVDGSADEAVHTYLENRLTGGRLNLSRRTLSGGDAQIVDAWLEQDGRPIDVLLCGRDAEIVIQIRVKRALRFAIELLLRQQDGMPVAFVSSGVAKNWRVEAHPGDITVRCRLPHLHLARGDYSIDLKLATLGFDYLDQIESGLNFCVDSTALGEATWNFSQSKGFGCLFWDVDFMVEPSGPEDQPSGLGQLSALSAL